LLFLAVSVSAQDRGLEVRSTDGTRLGSFKASYALVIGESVYTAGWPKPVGVNTDVQLVSKALSESGFQVTVKQDLSSDVVKQAYEDFIEMYGLDEANRLLFHYAGHGHTLKLAGGRDMEYIVPVDAPKVGIEKPWAHDLLFEVAIAQTPGTTCSASVSSTPDLFIPAVGVAEKRPVYPPDFRNEGAPYLKMYHHSRNRLETHAGYRR